MRVTASGLMDYELFSESTYSASLKKTFKEICLILIRGYFVTIDFQREMGGGGEETETNWLPPCAPQPRVRPYRGAP